MVANSPTPGVVKLYVLESSGRPAGAELKAQVLAACNPDEVRAFTDLVSVADPETVSYNVDLTYYLSEESQVKAADVQKAVEEAVRQYIAWQCGRLGRDINPSYLHGLLMQTGIKRAVIAEPVYTSLRDWRQAENSVPQVAAVGTVSIRSGGWEDE